MQIIIIGAGFTGTALAAALCRGGTNSVTLVDSDESVIRRASGTLDCATMCAEISLGTLQDAGIEKADAMVCVTGSDEVNIVTCSMVSSLYPDVLKIARVRNTAYYISPPPQTATPASTGAHKTSGSSMVMSTRATPAFGIDWMISPDKEAAAAMVRAVEHGAAGNVLSFSGSDYVLTRIPVSEGSKLCNKTLASIRGISTTPFLVAYLETPAPPEQASVSDTVTCLPQGSTLITADCTLGVITSAKNTAAVQSLCGTEQKELHDIAIVGAGRIGTMIAEQLLGDWEETSRQNDSTSHSAAETGGVSKRHSSWLQWAGRKVAQALASVTSKRPSTRHIVLIDSNEALATAASQTFDKRAKVFCADATDESFLTEEGIAHYDLAICATHNHEMNMVLAAFLENLGVGQSVALVESSAFASIATKLGVDVAVPLRDTVVDSILSHLRGKSVLGVHTVPSGNMEIIECVVSSSEVIGKKLQEISRPGQFLILLVRHTPECKGGSTSYEIPRGSTVLSAGDSCILIVQSACSTEIVAMFGGTK